MSFQLSPLVLAESRVRCCHELLPHPHFLLLVLFLLLHCYLTSIFSSSSSSSSSVASPEQSSVGSPELCSGEVGVVFGRPRLLFGIIIYYTTSRRV